MAGTLLNEAALRDEAEAYVLAGLPSKFLEAHDVAERFGIAPRAAILSDGSYEVDPVKVTLGVLARARASGASICFPFDVQQLDHGFEAIILTADDGRHVSASQVILALGYQRPILFLPPAFSVGSSYAIATKSGVAPLWRENAMIWEASSPISTPAPPPTVV